MRLTMKLTVAFLFVCCFAGSLWEEPVRADRGVSQPTTNPVRALTLTQNFQMISGTLGNQAIQGRLRGNEIALTSGKTEYSGRVSDDRIDGFAATAGRQAPWIAVRRLH